MARLAGVDLPRDKRMEIALTYIYGVGRTRSHEILSATGVSPELRTKDLTDEDLVRLREYIEENYKVEGDLRREVQADIRRKIEIGCYEGLRWRRGLPVRGQRTKTTQSTCRCRHQEGSAQGKKERCAWSCAHQVDVQQHDRLDHRPHRCGDRVGIRGSRGVQGLS
jgi:small subunit ribosomal protein S13